jgi:hypothetical protein
MKTIIVILFFVKAHSFWWGMPPSDYWRYIKYGRIQMWAKFEKHQPLVDAFIFIYSFELNSK